MICQVQVNLLVSVLYETKMPLTHLLAYIFQNIYGTRSMGDIFKISPMKASLFCKTCPRRAIWIWRAPNLCLSNLLYLWSTMTTETGFICFYWPPQVLYHLLTLVECIITASIGSLATHCTVGCGFFTHLLLWEEIEDLARSTNGLLDLLAEASQINITWLKSESFELFWLFFGASWPWTCQATCGVVYSYLGDVLPK